MSQTVKSHLDQKGGIPIQNSSMTAISGAVGRVSTAAESMGLGRQVGGTLWPASGFTPAT